jgi:HK97 family phage major capsid protein
MAEIVKEVSEQLKEILPALIGAKNILGDAAEDHKLVKDLADQIKNLQASVIDMGKNVVELGKRKIYVKSSGMSDEAKIDFAKWIIACYKFRKTGSADYHKTMKEMVDKYRAEGKGSLQEGTDSEGGYLVPDMFRDQIWRTAEQASVVMRLATKVPLTPGYKLPIISLSSSVTVDWVDEEGTITESDPVFAKSTVSAKKLAAYSVISNELLEDEEVGLSDLLIQLFGEAVGAKIDNVGLQANGPVFMGVLRTSGVNLVTMTGGLGKFSEITADYLSDAISLIKAPNLAGAKFFFHRTILNHIRKLKDTTNQYIWAPPVQGEPGTIWGYPYEVCEQMPSNSDSAVNTPFIFFGNLKNYLVGTKGEMTVKISDIPKILTDQSIIVIRKRIAMAAGLAEAFAVIKTANVDS